MREADAKRLEEILTRLRALRDAGVWGVIGANREVFRHAVSDLCFVINLLRDSEKEREETRESRLAAVTVERDEHLSELNEQSQMISRQHKAMAEVTRERDDLRALLGVVEQPESDVAYDEGRSTWVRHTSRLKAELDAARKEVQRISADRDALQKINGGRVVGPTDEETLAHAVAGGSWIFLWKEEDGTLSVRVVDDMDGVRGWRDQDFCPVVQWWPISANKKLCPWPVVGS